MNTSGDELPLHHQLEMVRVRQAFATAAHELGAVGIESKLVAAVDDREALAATISFLIEGLRFETRVALLRRQH